MGGLVFNHIIQPQDNYNKILSSTIEKNTSAFLASGFNILDLISIISFWSYVIISISGQNDYYFLKGLATLKIFRLMVVSEYSMVFLN